MMKSEHELIVVGGGPAGMAAATSAAEQGVDTLLLDEQATLGGQIYRNIEHVPAQTSEWLGKDYQHGQPLLHAFHASNARHQANTRIWSISRDRSLGILHNNKAQLIQAEHIILAGGAMERPLPFPGWTLPGVMNAGAAQIMLKSANAIPEDGVVIAGTGPLLLLLGWQYLHAGVPIKAILELSPLSNFWQALPRLPAALMAGHYIGRGLKYLLALRRAGIPIILNVNTLRAVGDQTLQTVEYQRGSRTHQIKSRHLLVHFGLQPNLHLTELAACRHHWHAGQQCWTVDSDDWGNTNRSSITVAGDGASIGGARAAKHQGVLAGLEAAYALRAISREQRDRLGKKDRQWMQADLRIRPFLQQLHRLPESLLATPENDTLVCRCEEITAGQIRQAVQDGHHSPNAVKFFSRCGMGPCQGRQCGSAVAHIVAQSLQQPIESQHPFRARPPAQPLTFKQLANLQTIEPES